MPGKVSLGMKRLGDEHVLDGTKIKKDGENADVITAEELKAKVAYKEEMQNEIDKHKDILAQYKQDLEAENYNGNTQEQLQARLDGVKTEMVQTIKEDVGMEFYVKEIDNGDGTKSDVLFLHNPGGTDYVWEAFEGNEEAVETELTALYKDLYDFDLGHNLGIEDDLSFDLIESEQEIATDLAGLQAEVTDPQTGNAEAASATDAQGIGVVQSVIDFVKGYNPNTSPAWAKGAIEGIKMAVSVIQSFGGTFLAGLFSLPGTGDKLNELASVLGVNQSTVETSVSESEITIPEGFENLTETDFDLTKGLLPADYKDNMHIYLRNYGLTNDNMIDSEELDTTLKEGTPSAATIKTTLSPTVEAIAQQVGVEEELLLADAMLWLGKRKDKQSLDSHIPGVGEDSEWEGMTVKFDGKDLPYMPDRNSGLIIAAKAVKKFSDENTDLNLHEKMIALCDGEESEEEYINESFEEVFEEEVV